MLSDSHGYISSMERAVEAIKPNYILHLGDCVRDADKLSQLYPGIPLIGVPGNCDYAPEMEAEKLIELGGVRILMMHGHTRGVKSTILSAVYAAREATADVLLFGHTHEPLVDNDNGLWILNPGTIGAGFRSTYGVITSENGKIDIRTYNS